MDHDSIPARPYSYSHKQKSSCGAAFAIAFGDETKIVQAKGFSVMRMHNGHANGPAIGVADRTDLLDRAVCAAERTLELDPHNLRVRLHKATAHFFRKELDAFLEEADRALALNENDAETLATLGYLLCQVGRHDRGVPMIKKAISLNPFQRNWYQHPTFRNAFLKGDYERALEIARPEETAASFWSFVYHEVENADPRDVEVAQRDAQKTVDTVKTVAKGAYDAFSEIRMGDRVRLSDESGDDGEWVVTGRSFGTMTYDLSSGDAIAPDRTLTGVHVSFLNKIDSANTAEVKVMTMVPAPKPAPRPPHVADFTDIASRCSVNSRKIAR